MSTSSMFSPTPPNNEDREIEKSGRRISLSFKLPLAVISLLLISLTVYTFLSIRLSQQALVATLRNELQDQVTTKVEVIQSDLLVAKAIASQLAALLKQKALKKMMSYSSCKIH